MKPGPAYVNKILKKQQLDRDLELHYRSLKTVKPLTDSNEP